MTTRSPASRAASPSARLSWFLLGGLATVMVIALGAVLLWQLSFTGTELSRHTGHDTLSSVDTPAAVEIDGSGANVELTGTETAEAAADLSLGWYASERPAIQDEWEGTTWTVGLGCGHEGIPLWFAPGCEIDYAGDVPAEADVEVSLSSGSLTARNISGTADLRTTSGSIEAHELSGDLAVSTTSGDIHGFSLTAEDVAAETTSASTSLELVDVPKQVRAEATSGDIEILVPRGAAYQVLTDTSSDRVSVDVATDPEAESVLDLRTTSGSITVAYSD